MPAPVRLVSDGEEMVLSRGESFRIRPRPGSHHAVIGRARESAGSQRIAIQYLGFHDVSDRREYVLSAQRGDQAGRYTLSIALAAFANRQALLQDGPDICYQKLLRELAGAELQGADGIVVTEGDLAAYRESHTPPKRGRLSLPRTPGPSKAQADASAGEGGTLASPPRSTS
jgi:hypothetical protein